MTGWLMFEYVERHRLHGFIPRAFQPVEKGSPVGPTRVVVDDVAGSCTNRVIVRKETFVDREFHVRCRRCPSCLRSHQFLWTLRGQAEILLAPQTVLFTGTFRRQTWDLEVAKDETTRWLKRCRYYLEKAEEDVRYLVVPERHKSGAWHIHALLHSERSVAKTLFDNSWNAGFSNTKYADWKSAEYVTKYVAKNLLDDPQARVPRIRASRAPTYGAWVMERDKEKVRELLASKPKEHVHRVWKKNLSHLIRDLKKNQEMNLMEKVEVQVLEYQK